MGDVRIIVLTRDSDHPDVTVCIVAEMLFGHLVVNSVQTIAEVE